MLYSVSAASGLSDPNTFRLIASASLASAQLCFLKQDRRAGRLDKFPALPQFSGRGGRQQRAVAQAESPFNQSCEQRRWENLERLPDEIAA